MDYKQSMSNNKGLPKHQNWLLWVSYVGPHEPFDTPKQWDFVDAERLPVTIKQSEWIARLKDSCELKKSKIKWEGKLNSKEVKELRVDYGNKLKLLDDQLNKLMNEIHDREDAKNTAVCITSDHGEMLGDHGMLYKNTFLEQAIRVPMIYISPDAKRRHRMTCKEPIQTTKALKAILRNLRKQGKTRRLQKWATKQQGAIVEHNDEIAFISRDHKLCCTQKGEFLWATRPEKDPNETVNYLESTERELEDKLNKIKIWAMKEVKKRNKSSWIWRDLKNQLTG